MKRRWWSNAIRLLQLALATLVVSACQSNVGFEAEVDAGPVVQSSDSPEVGSASLRATSGELVTLDASSFLGLQGAAFHWAQLSGPAVALGDPSAQTQSFVAPDVSEVDFLILGLDAIADEISVKTVITITILPAGSEPPPPSCDDGLQNGDETGVDCGGSCPACPPEVVCGDNSCDASEDCQSCEWDCGTCEVPPVCGDGTCDSGEDCSSCEADCGTCASSGVCGSLGDACHSDPLGDSDYCSDSCPCGWGEGDCDNDDQCQGDLVCTKNIGADFGRRDGEDICVLPNYPNDQACSGDDPAPTPSCGDGTCDSSEDCNSCASDCGSCPPPPSSCGDVCQTPPPPTGNIEGYGAQTRGADGCNNPQTFHVTTLSDSGSGSFRDAISQGCRHIVFDVGGTIVLRDDLAIEDSFITIDGSTAPAPGITFEHGADYKLTIKAGSGDVHDIIARYLRHVGPGGHPDSSQDFWGFDATSSGDIYNVALEHLTLTGSTDGIFDFNANESRNAYYNITLAYNFIHTQARAASIRGAQDISVHHNVWARVDDRGPKYSDQAEAHHINNVHYQWGYVCHRGAPHGLSLDSDGTVDPKVLAEYNYFAPADTPSCGSNPNEAIFYRSGVGGSQLFLRGNHLPPEETDTGSVSSSPISVPSWATVSVTPVDQLGDTLVPCAGTVYPTQAEKDLLQEVSLAVGGQGGSCQ